MADSTIHHEDKAHAAYVHQREMAYWFEESTETWAQRAVEFASNSWGYNLSDATRNRDR